MIARSLSRKVLRLLVGGYQSVRRAGWFVTRPRTFGAHAVPITPEGRIILVRLRYAEGWRLPGGGRKAQEDPQEAALRELREEIGMTGHGSVQLATELEEIHDFKRDKGSLFIVRDVEYSPRWSFEVEAVREAELDRLPDDTAQRTRRWLAAVRPLL